MFLVFSVFKYVLIVPTGMIGLNLCNGVMKPHRASGPMQEEAHIVNGEFDRTLLKRLQKLRRLHAGSAKDLYKIN